MKDRYTLLRDIKASLQPLVDADQLETITDCILNVLAEYEVTDRPTAMVVREDENERILKKYAACLYVDGRAEGTIEGYLYRLKDFYKEMQVNYKDVSVYDIRFYLGILKQRGDSNSTIEGVRQYLSAFYGWMHNEGLIQSNPCSVLKPIKYNCAPRQPFTEVEIEKIRNSCKNIRERALVETLLSTGVRVSELMNLNINDIDFEHNVVKVEHGKGDKDRITFINAVAAYHLKEYLKTRTDSHQELFRSKLGRLQPGGIRKILKDVEARSCVTNIHPHRFRHTFATVLSSKGMPIQHIQQLLGHSNLDTTMIYVSIDKSQIQHEYSRMFSC